MNGAPNPPICPCGTITNPWVVFNPPGQPAISYRWGNYTSFRYALLQALPGEAALSQVVTGQLRQIWRPTAEGDLALQMVEWWAYLADVLTFYCERIGTQAYLDTADRPESANRMIQLLGYRPRPALGATSLVAALVDGPKPVLLPQGLQIQSKPGAGQQPQIFELKSATTIGNPDVLPLITPPPPAPVLSGAVDAQGRKLASLTAAGTVGGLKAGDEVLLIENGWAGADGGWGVGIVQQATPQPDPTGAANTGISVAVTSAGGSLAQGLAAGYRLLKSSGTVPLFQYAGAGALTKVMSEGAIGPNGYTGQIALSSITRQIVVGDPVVIENPAPGATDPPLAASVTAYAETVYYANNPADPSTPPTGDGVIPIPMPVSVITFATQGVLFGNPSSIVVRYGWKDLGTLIDLPLATAGGATPAAALELRYTPPDGFAPTPGTPLLVQDANGDGAAASIDTADTVTISTPAPTLTAPLSALLNLLAVTRGRSVPSEVLGSGDSAILGQDFTLQNAPVTYLQDAASVSGDDYSSTVKVWVNGIQWQEVRSSYGLPADAQVFLTREDEQGKTHVVFNGRLPTGVNNIVASYRYGAGAQAPASGSLTMVLQPQPGLSAIANPVAPSGGADADPPDKIRKLAPLSVMTFNRAVSLDDYRIIAGSAPGVARAAAAYVFDPASQRPVVAVWVGDDEGAVAAAQNAIAASADPNRLPLVKLATQVTMTLSLTYLRDPRYQHGSVQAALQSALLDPDEGLFGINAVGIGEVFYASQIYAACLAIPGVQAIHDLSFVAPPRFSSLSSSRRPILIGTGRLPVRPKPIFGGPRRACTGEHYDPGPGGYYAVPAANLHLAGGDAP
jgi:hypothetical protein